MLADRTLMLLRVKTPTILLKRPGLSDTHWITLVTGAFVSFCNFHKCFFWSIVRASLKCSAMSSKVVFRKYRDESCSIRLLIPSFGKLVSSLSMSNLLLASIFLVASGEARTPPAMMRLTLTNNSIRSMILQSLRAIGPVAKLSATVSRNSICKRSLSWMIWATWTEVFSSPKSLRWEIWASSRCSLTRKGITSRAFPSMPSLFRILGMSLAPFLEWSSPYPFPISWRRAAKKSQWAFPSSLKTSLSRGHFSSYVPFEISFTISRVLKEWRSIVSTW